MDCYRVDEGIEVAGTFEVHPSGEANIAELDDLPWCLIQLGFWLINTERYSTDFSLTDGLNGQCSQDGCIPIDQSQKFQKLQLLILLVRVPIHPIFRP